MTCSYSKEYSTSVFTDVENAFIREYMPISDGDAVKVYLYGLYLCQNPAFDQSVEEIAKTLNLSIAQIIDYFKYWEEFALVSVNSENPLSVQYFPVRSTMTAKPRKYKAEKYAEFTKSLQMLISARMISTSEYSEYFNIMETYGIKSEAMLMIVKYCTDRKGNDISYKYISKVAKDFGNRGIVTVDKIEKELSSYILRTAELEKILSALSLRRQPELEDLNLYKKWTKDLNFESDSIIYAAKTIKKGSMDKLDAFIMELYSQKSFSKEEIKTYSEKQQAVYELAIKINKALSVYEEVISTVVDTYTNKWLSYGFTDDALLFVASQCFRAGTNTLAQMDERIEKLRERGVIDIASINDLYESEKKVNDFISSLLITAGVNRRPNAWDRENLNTWKSWNFSNEMILEAARLSSGKSSPIAYINGILSNWKNNDIFTIDAITNEQISVKDKTITQEAYNLEYTHRRNVAVTRAQKNVDTAMTIEGFPTLYERTFSIEKDLAFAEISGNDEALRALEQEKAVNAQKIADMLASVGLKIDDLSPKYNCSKCNDTGYVGTERCDCFNK